MNEYEASFLIESKSDAYAVERLMNQLYDSLREESLTVREGTTSSGEMLDQFKDIRDATSTHSPGQLTIVYEQRDEDSTQ